MILRRLTPCTHRLHHAECRNYFVCSAECHNQRLDNEIQDRHFRLPVFSNVILLSNKIMINYLYVQCQNHSTIHAIQRPMNQTISRRMVKNQLKTLHLFGLLPHRKYLEIKSTMIIMHKGLILFVLQSLRGNFD